MASNYKIFLSYRRDDSADITGRIYDQLIQHIGKDSLFRDVDAIPLGVDFRSHIDQTVGQCDILLAVVGREWLTMTDEEGNRRLDSPSDFVRLEIESALNRDIPVVPLLVRGAAMPKEEELPEQIKTFAYRNGIQIRRDPDFHNDVSRLIDGLGKYLSPESAGGDTPAPVPSPQVTPGPGQPASAAQIQPSVDSGSFIRRWWRVAAYVIAIVLMTVKGMMDVQGGELYLFSAVIVGIVGIDHFAGRRWVRGAVAEVLLLFLILFFLISGNLLNLPFDLSSLETVLLLVPALVGFSWAMVDAIRYEEF